MRAIAAPFFERSPFLLGPVFTLVLFFVVFVGVVLYLMRSKTLRFDTLSNLPLSDAPPEPSGGVTDESTPRAEEE
jgi:cbb3-type cytochrome oxidase subunit 3